jgi:uncharacterized integral membrane protein
MFCPNRLDMSFVIKIYYSSKIVIIELFWSISLNKAVFITHNSTQKYIVTISEKFCKFHTITLGTAIVFTSQ